MSKTDIQELIYEKPYLKKALETFRKDVKEEVTKTDMTSIIQDKYHFNASMYTLKDNLSLLDESNANHLLYELRAAALEENGIIQATKVNGDLEFALRGEAYNLDGKIIKDNFYEHFQNDDIYFNTDEKFLEYQKEVLLNKDLEENMKNVKMPKLNEYER
jgi:hypothetical protein